jgi:hypothetical protein
VVTVSIGFSAWNEKYVSTKDTTMRDVSTGLCALCDEGCALLTSESD